MLALLLCLLLRYHQVLNVQVPFYFKSIVDSMNVDFAALGGTAWTVGGAMIVACTKATLREQHVADRYHKMVPHE